MMNGETFAILGILGTSSIVHKGCLQQNAARLAALSEKMAPTSLNPKP